MKLLLRGIYNFIIIIFVSLIFGIPMLILSLFENILLKLFKFTQQGNEFISEIISQIAIQANYIKDKYL